MIWLQDRLLSAAEARIDPADRGLLLGDGLFETMAVRNGVVLRYADHAARFGHGCAVLAMPRPAVDIPAALQALVAANGLKDAVLRLTWTRGVGPRGVMPPSVVTPTLLITCADLPPPLPPARCIVATVTRRNQHSPLTRIKSLNYLDSILARQQASEAGADDAIMLNTDGAVAEATTSNLFIVKAGRVMTPPVADGALPGVMRATVIAATKAVEQTLRPEDVMHADEVFLTNSLGIRTVAGIEGKAMSAGAVALYLNQSIDAGAERLGQFA